MIDNSEAKIKGYMRQFIKCLTDVHPYLIWLPENSLIEINQVLLPAVSGLYDEAERLAKENEQLRENMSVILGETKGEVVL